MVGVVLVEPLLVPSGDGGGCLSWTILLVPSGDDGGCLYVIARG